MTTTYITSFVKAPYLEINNLNIARASNTTLTVTNGQCRDSTNNFDIIQTVASTTINFATTGVNALDTGTFAASTVYAIYAIMDPTSTLQPAFIGSTSLTGPLMPFGYGASRLIGYWTTDGSAHFLLGNIFGSQSLRTFYFDTQFSALTGGTATTLTAIDLSAAVPVIDNTPVSLNVTYTPNAAGDSVSIAPFGSTATVLPSLSGSVAAVAQKAQLQCLAKVGSGAIKLLYINSAASGSTNVLVDSYTYSL